MKTLKAIIGIGVLLGIGLVVGTQTGLLFNERPRDASDWETTIVKRRDLGSSVLATGIIKPQVGAEVRVGSRVSGILKRLYVNIGDPVKKGALLSELDPTEYQAQYNQALAAREHALADREYARLDLERKRQLFEKQFSSKEEVDLAERAYRVAEARVKETEANLEYAQIQLDYTRIRAPVAGVVASIATQVGETVAASFASPTFVTIIDLDRLEVWAYVDETDIGRIEVGQRASFQVDTYPDVDFEGQVTAIYPKAEIQDNVVNYVTIVEITDSKGRTLRPEMTTTINIFLASRDDVLAVPHRALRKDDGRHHVYVLQDGQPQKRPVTAGFRGKSYTEITEGLSPQEVVILDEVE